VKKAAAYIALAAAAIGFAWAAQAYVPFRYVAAAAIVIVVIYVLFRSPQRSSAATIADFQALKRERTRLIALQEKARLEKWSYEAQAGIARGLAQVEQRLSAHQ